MNEFHDLVDLYRRQFPGQGSLELRRGDSIRERVYHVGVPSERGVYLIYGRRRRRTRLLCIGKAGTLRQDGTFKRQRLRGRLCAKQGRVPRQQWYQREINRLGLDALVFDWFVTYDNNLNTLPVKAESDLLQAYFEQYGRLPEWNECA